MPETFIQEGPFSPSATAQTPKAGSAPAMVASPVQEEEVEKKEEESKEESKSRGGKQHLQQQV